MHLQHIDGGSDCGEYVQGRGARRQGESHLPAAELKPGDGSASSVLNARAFRSRKVPQTICHAAALH